MMNARELYRVLHYEINARHPLYPYARNVSGLANNLANATRFRQRQILTAVQKDPSAWTENEREIMDELSAYMPLVNAKYQFTPSAKKYRLSYGFLDNFFKVSANPDYFADGLPRQTAQGVIKQCCKDMDGFFASVREFRKDPSKYTGMPRLPGYKRKGGYCTCYISNQDAVLYEANNQWELKLPLTKVRLRCGPVMPDAVLKEVKLKPKNGIFEFVMVFAVKKNVPAEKVPDRIAAVDFGVENLMAVTNNCGLPCLLYKGGPIKAANQWYNKRMAEIVSEQTKSTGGRFVPTPESEMLTRYRNDYISDFLHKTAKRFVLWCVEHFVDTVVAGVNKSWKQNIEIGKVNNQKFVQIPFSDLRWMLSYLCEEHGIRFIEREESYTSKASFPDNDPIPSYGSEDTNPAFSGYRAPTSYRGMHKKGGFRGLYVTSDGSVINSDLNGSANILRKEFPEAFSNGIVPCFNDVEIVHHPDEEKSEALRKRQLANRKGISKSKAKRLLRKKTA